MTRIWENLKVAQDRKKSYVDKNKVFRDFKVGKHVFSKSERENKFAKIGLFPKVGCKILWEF
jgi:hypothetical protein